MLEEAKKTARNQQIEREAESSNRAATYHRAFVQNKAGKEVLDNWVRMYCMTPIAKPDATLFQAGIAEGRRLIIREILDHIAFVEGKK